MVEWEISWWTDQIQILQDDWGLEDFQRYYQEDKTLIFQWQNSRNHIKKPNVLEPHWVKKCKLLAIEALQYNRHPYIEINDIW